MRPINLDQPSPAYEPRIRSRLEVGGATDDHLPPFFTEDLVLNLLYCLQISMTVSQAIVRTVQPVSIWSMTTVVHALLDRMERTVTQVSPLPIEDTHISIMAFLS